MAWLLPLGFEENDDVMMAMIANGSYSGAPDYHLVYINVLYGWVLAGLYSLSFNFKLSTLNFIYSQCLSFANNRAKPPNQIVAFICRAYSGLYCPMRRALRMRSCIV